MSTPIEAVSHRRESGTRRTVAYMFLAGCAIMLAAGYYENLVWLWSRWMDNPDYSHGPLIPLVSGTIVYLRRESLRQFTGDNGRGGLVLFAGAFLLQVVSRRMQVNFLESYAFILSIAGCIWFLFGRRVASELLFPICFLIFMVPFWGTALDKVGNILKTMSSITSFHLINFMGFPIHLDGVVLQLSRGSLEVADPCSGVRSLVSLLAVGTLMAYFSRIHWTKKVLVALLAVPFAFIWNTFRVVAFGIILETTGVLISDGFWHTFTGLLVFALALLSLFAVNKWVASK